VVISIHHIITDMWSMQIIKREIKNIYDQLRQDPKGASREPAYWQFRDFAALLKKTPFDSHREYWKNRFSGKSIPRLHLSRQPRPPVRTFEADVLVFHMNPALFNTLKKTALDADVTFFCCLLATVHCLLARLSGEKFITTGVPSSGRETPELQNMIGYFLNTVIISSYLSSEDSFLDFVKKMKNELGEAMDHHQYPFSQLVRDLNLDRDVSRHPVFDVMVTYEQQEEAKETDLHVQDDIWLTGWKVKYDLLFSFSGIGNLKGLFIFNKNLFDTDDIRFVKEEFFSIVRKIAENPHVKVKTIIAGTGDVPAENLPFSENDFA